jgi:hypothetical protein
MKTVENDDLMELESQLDDQSKQSSSVILRPIHLEFGSLAICL